ncbi:MAG: LPS export ABC transporter permease LptF [Rhodospirillales bacterium]
MNGLTRYMLKQLAVGMLLVSAGLTCVIWLSQSLRLVDLIVNRGISTGTFLHLTLLLLPNFLEIILPVALFTVIVFVYAKMITDREIVVMRAAGISHAGLARPAFLLILLVMGFSYYLNLSLLPESYRAFKNLQWDIRFKYSHVLLQEGRFNEAGGGIVVYVRERSTDGQLLGILVHDSRTPETPRTTMASRGAMVKADDGARLVMFEGNHQEISPESGELSMLYFDRWVFEIPQPEGQGAVRHREARERTIGELLNPEKNEHLGVIDYGKFRTEGHKRLLSPVRAAGFAVIGLACILGGPANRRSQWRKIIFAVGLMVALLLSAFGLEGLAAKRPFLIPLLYVHAFLPAVIGLAVVFFPPRRRTPANEPPGFASEAGA